ncbi:MAG: YeeE/YedE family protein, partial [Gammaproteobacteria bacterium]|nr:YeeE/YedE family protein [Gammaproteobacteria bacterium]
KFAWVRYILGGVMCGVGMTLAGGCVSRNLVRIGGGNLKSLVTLLIVAYFAFLMTKTRFFEVMFYNWLQPLSVDFSSLGLESQDFGSFIYQFIPLGNPGVIRLVLVVLAVMLCWYFIKRTRGFRGNGHNIVAGVVIGLAVVAGWYLTSGPTGMAWVEAAEWADNPPVGVGAQSFTFVNPLGEYVSLALELENASVLITVGMLAALGLLLGSSLDAIFRRQFKFTWFASFSDFVFNAIGGVLMGIGGVLALGCTIGQGITGMATLAIGSVLTVAAIILSSALTLKTQYYKLIYEEASVVAALVTGMVDLKMLPKSFRKLEAL